MCFVATENPSVVSTACVKNNVVWLDFRRLFEFCLQRIMKIRPTFRPFLFPKMTLSLLLYDNCNDKRQLKRTSDPTTPLKRRCGVEELDLLAALEDRQRTQWHRRVFAPTSAFLKRLM